MKLREAIARFKEIALKNDDAFAFSIDIDRGGGLSLCVTERADGHDFAGAEIAVDPDQLEVDLSEDDIKSFCQPWGYET